MVEKGFAKSIGLSNFNQKQIQRVIDNCTILPANLQVILILFCLAIYKMKHVPDRDAPLSATKRIVEVLLRQ